MSAQLFWKVTGNGLERESYILGTMHNARTGEKIIDFARQLISANNSVEVVITPK